MMPFTNLSVVSVTADFIREKNGFAIYSRPVFPMNNDHFVCEVRCPVQGFIGLTELERDVVNHADFRRLRRIKQLGWTDYMYPGAFHTRSDWRSR